MNRFLALILLCLALLSGYAATRAAQQTAAWQALDPSHRAFSIQLDWSALGENSRALRVIQEAPGAVRLPGIFYG